MKKIVAVLVLVLAVAGCTESNSNSARKAQSNDRKVAEQQLASYQRNQPTPIFTWSQLRQNLIEIETAQSQTTQTTTFYRLGSSQRLSLPQIEANGVYTADSTGTFVICVDANGKPYAVYWEGFVQTVAGPAKWDGTHVELIGNPSFKFSKGKH